MISKLCEAIKLRIAAVYIRVSTDRQTEYSPDAQLKAIYEYAQHNNIIIKDSLIFRDEGISGRKAETRPAFMQMIRLAKSKEQKFDVILVHKFSRFARSREDSIVYKSMLRKECGIDVISITEPITDDKFSIVIEAMHEAMDEYYSINLSSEVIKGMKEKAIRGEFQAAPPFGYRKSPGQPLQIVEKEAKYVRLIFDWYLAGESYFSIARKLNTLGVLTKRGNRMENRNVEYILNNPVYKGYTRWTPSKTINKQIIDNPDTIIIKSSHQAIISEKQFDQVALKIKTNRIAYKKRDRPAESKKHYLSGIIKCSNCGSTLSYSSSSDAFQCIKYAKGACKQSHHIQAKKIENAILKKLSKILISSLYIESKQVIKYHNVKIELVEKQLDQLDKIMARAKLAYLKGVDSLEDYSQYKEKIQKESKNKLIELQYLKSKDKKADSIHIQNQVSSAIEILTGNAPISKKNKALKSIVEKIIFYRAEDTLVIYFYI